MRVGWVGLVMLACGAPPPPTPPPGPRPAVVMATAPADAAVNLETQDASGWTPLMRAAQRGALDEIDALLRAGANIDADSDTVYGGATPLLIALEYSEPEAATLLLDRGASIRGRIGDQALVLAARGGSGALVERLLAAGVVASTSAVALAAKGGYAEVITRLVRAGAAVDVANAEDHDFTPLMVACMENQPAAAQVLLEAGARVDATDDDGDTPLHWAVFGARPVEIHEYEDLGKPHDTYWEPRADAPVVAMLLAAKANPGARNHHGDTPLHQAALMDAAAAARLLVAAGASRSAKNSDGKTPYDLAKDRHNSVEAVLAPKRP